MRKVVGVFQRDEDARQAIDSLKRQGYNTDNLSLVAKDYQGGAIDNEASNAATGAGIGGLLGGIGGLLVGLGALAIPGIGPIVAAGPLVTTLGGAAAGAATGGIIGALTEMGIDEQDAKRYNQHFEDGDILLIADDEADNSNIDVYDAFSSSNALNTADYPEKYHTDYKRNPDYRRY